MKLKDLVLVFQPVLLGTALISQNAQAISFSLVGVGNQTRQTASPDPGTDVTQAKLGIGAGALLEIGVAPMIGLEFGGLYHGYKFDDTDVSSGIITTTEMKALEFPVLFKLHLSALHFGLGGSYEMASGSIKGTDVATGVSIDATYAQNGVKKSGINGVGAMGLDLPIGPLTSLLLEGRYKMSLTSRSDGMAATLHYNSVEFLVGLTFGIMK